MKQMLQFSYDGPVNIEHRQAWMDIVTQSKFSAWDDVVARNLMEVGTDVEKSQIAKMLEDPTIYCYAFFRDEWGRPFRLYSYQDMMLNDPCKRVVFVAANQIGKSVSLRVKAITYALRNPGKTVIMTSKTLPQSVDLLRGIKQILNRSSVEYKTDVGATETKTAIEFRNYDILPNGAQQELEPSRIICVPATEAALGYPADLFLIDEEDSYENGHQFYAEVAQPRTYTTKGQIITFSNPWNGEDGVLHEHYVNKRFSKYRMDYLDRPGATQREFDEIASDLSQAEIDCTLLAVFTSMKGAFLSKEERAAIQEQRPNELPITPTGPWYVFFDFAKVEDRTVRGIASPSPNGGIYFHEIKEYPSRTPYDAVVDDLKQLIANYTPQQFVAIGWDNSGVGAGVEDFINKIQLIGIPCVPVKFSLENKSRMYTVFKTLAERSLRVDEQGHKKRMLSMPWIKNCDTQLRQLRFERTGGNMKVHHENENDRDDFPDCIAGMCGLMVHPDYVPSSAEVIGPQPQKSLSYDKICEDCKNPLEEEQTECGVCGKKTPANDWSGVV